MKTLGMVGGLSWHSTLDYYSFINMAVNNHFGNNTNPPLILYNLNQAKVHHLQKQNKWESIADMLLKAVKQLQKAGAESAIFCANTPHKVYDLIQKQVDIPIIHIADATVWAIHQKGLNTVGFIGTKYSMENDFVTGRIEQNGIKVIVPDEQNVIKELHRIIHEELTYNKIILESKRFVLNELNQMIRNGAKGIVLGCTEFPLMIHQKDINVPAFNTTLIHSAAAVRFILEE
jgi:aspartate racemase